MQNDKNTFGISKKSHLAIPLKHLLQTKIGGTKWKRKIDRTNEWVAW
jgi:hypothetical protein